MAPFSVAAIALQYYSAGKSRKSRLYSVRLSDEKMPIDNDSLLTLDCNQSNKIRLENGYDEKYCTDRRRRKTCGFDLA
jgi:hypothetical protein